MRPGMTLRFDIVSPMASNVLSSASAGGFGTSFLGTLNSMPKGDAGKVRGISRITSQPDSLIASPSSPIKSPASALLIGHVIKTDPLGNGLSNSTSLARCSVERWRCSNFWVNSRSARSASAALARCFANSISSCFCAALVSAATLFATAASLFAASPSAFAEAMRTSASERIASCSAPSLTRIRQVSQPSTRPLTISTAMYTPNDLSLCFAATATGFWDESIFALISSTALVIVGSIALAIAIRRNDARRLMRITSIT